MKRQLENGKQKLNSINSNMRPELRKELQRLKNISTPQSRDIDLIFSLYKNFIDKDVMIYTTGCNCSNSIETFYKKLMDWYDTQPPEDETT